MLIHKERLTGSTASGSLTRTTAKFSGVVCKQLYIKPTTATTTFNVAITDKDADTVYEEVGYQGTLIREVEIPLSGNYTVSITSASADEAFTIFLAVQEEA